MTALLNTSTTSVHPAASAPVVRATTVDGCAMSWAGTSIQLRATGTDHDDIGALIARYPL